MKSMSDIEILNKITRYLKDKGIIVFLNHNNLFD